MDMLMLEKGVNWNDLDTSKKRGSCCYRTGERMRWYLDDDMCIFSSEEGRERYQHIVQ